MRAPASQNRVASSFLPMFTELGRAAKGHPGSPRPQLLPGARQDHAARAAPLTRAPGDPLPGRPGDTAQGGSIQTADSQGRQRNFDAAAAHAAGEETKQVADAGSPRRLPPARRKITRRTSPGDSSVLRGRPWAHLAVLDPCVQGKARGLLKSTVKRKWPTLLPTA